VNLDYLIVGHGLAGAALARLLLERGRRILVVDREDPAAASRVAAGLVNPVTGMKLVKTRQAEDFLPKATAFYHSWEAILGGKRFYHDRSVWRFFQSAREEEIWEKRRGSEELAEFVSPLPGHIPSDFLLPQSGGFRVNRAAYLDTRGMLGASRALLHGDGLLSEETINLKDVQVGDNSVNWRNVRAQRVIFCEGHSASENPWFSWIPFRHAKGEVLTVSGPSPLQEDVIFNRGKWLLPIGGRRYRAGATYEWQDLNTQPTAAGKEEILEGLRKLVPWEPVVEKHEAGIRPIVADTFPVIGLHPSQPRVGILNGLGSKGVLWAPYFAEQLVRHMEDGAAIDPAADIRRNL